MVASGVASQKGILVKSSEALENSHKAKTIVFDKTGTLTNGTLSISQIYNYSSNSDNEIIKKIASIEKYSEHPIAKAIVNYAEENNLVLEKVTDFKAIPGCGVNCKIENDNFFIGNEKLMIDNNIIIKRKQDAENLSLNGNSILFVVKNGELIALIGVKDIIRKNIKETIKSLKSKNINLVMLTGDNEKTAKYIANEIGIQNVIANVTPKEKAEKIKELQKKRTRSNVRRWHQRQHKPCNC